MSPMSSNWVAMMNCLISCVDGNENLQHALFTAISDPFINGEAKAYETMDNIMFESAGFNGADFHFQLLKTDGKQDSEDFNKWFNILWAEYPRLQWDNNPAPMRTKKVCKDRLRTTIKRTRMSPEQIVRAIAAYCTHCFENKHWIKSLDTVLGPQEVWKEFV